MLKYMQGYCERRKENSIMKKRIIAIVCLLALVTQLLVGCDFLNSFLDGLDGLGDGGNENPTVISLDDIPAFDGTTQSVIINGNIPFFEEEKTDSSYEIYSELDHLGRCGAAIACIGIDIMPTEDREEIGHVKPSGWHSVQYDIVPGKNLYNRCHLIGFQLAGENDNEKNLITGTRDLNNEGMLPIENRIAEYVKTTKNHVLYRVTPIYDGNNLVANGVLMEARSVEDNGDGIELCVYIYNAQYGVEIDYKTGESRLADDPLTDIVNSNHDDAEIIPARVPESVDAIYEETVDGEFSGCIVIVIVKGYAANIILAVDIDEAGRVVELYTVSESETHEKGNLDTFCESFTGVSSDEVGGVELVSGATVTAEAVRDGVKDALEAFKCYTDAMENGEVFIVNTSSEKFHKESCSGAQSMSESNKLVYIGFAEDLVETGYVPCGTCKPAN